jgi:hypothetical protein
VPLNCSNNRPSPLTVSQPPTMLGLMSSVLGTLIGIHHHSSASFITFNKFINLPRAMTTAQMPSVSSFQFYTFRTRPALQPQGLQFRRRTLGRNRGHQRTCAAAPPSARRLSCLFTSHLSPAVFSQQEAPPQPVVPEAAAAYTLHTAALHQIPL